MTDESTEDRKAWVERIARMEAPDASCEVTDYGNKATLHVTDKFGKRVNAEVLSDWDEDNLRSAVRRMQSGE